VHDQETFENILFKNIDILTALRWLL